MNFLIRKVNPAFSTNEALYLGIIRETKSKSGFATCLVSSIEFKGNSRFELDGLYIYPSIQASVWMSTLGEIAFATEKLPENVIEKFLHWPGLSTEKRQEVAGDVEMKYYSAQIGNRPTKQFNNLVSELFELAQDYVITQIEPNFMSIEKYVELWKRDPIALLDQGLNLDLAIGSKIQLSEHISILENNHRIDIKRDFTRVISQKLTDVLTQQNAMIVDPVENHYRYLTIMESLGIRRALVSEFKPDVNYLRTKNNGKTYTVYFTGGQDN